MFIYSLSRYAIHAVDCELQAVKPLLTCEGKYLYQRAYADYRDSAGCWLVYTSYPMVLCTIWIIRNVATLGNAIAWAADSRHAILPLSNGILSLYLLSLAFCQGSIQLHHKSSCYVYTPVGAYNKVL